MRFVLFPRTQHRSPVPESSHIRNRSNVWTGVRLLSRRYSAILGGIGGGVGAGLAKAGVQSVAKRIAIEGGIDFIASTVASVLQGGDIGDNLAMNLVVSFGGTAAGELVGKLFNRFGRNADEVIERGASQTDNVARNANPHMCSFTDDTYVATEDGYVEIGDLEVGDKVLAYNEETGEVDEYEVTAVHVHVDEEILYLVIDGELIVTTPDHPFYRDSEWIPAGDLELGDEILKADGTVGFVDSLEIALEPTEMYNLTVDDAHTFFVGDGQWLVHNTCPDLQPYKDGAGHHIHQSAAFREDPNYSHRDAPALPADKLEAYEHQDMTNKQRELYRKLGEDIDSGIRKNTIDEHSEIAYQALIEGGVPKDKARVYVDYSEAWLTSKNVTKFRIPWKRK